MQIQFIYFKIYNIFLIVSALVVVGCADEGPSSPNQTDVLSTFELAEGFQIELIAAEPLIADPVDMEIDEKGRMYVVEMHGYPLDKSGSGNVKILTDTDGDGIMDRAEVFADNLQFPTGVMRWKKGILVTDPPNVLYFEDKDGDGKSDIRDTIITGFAVSNPQHNVNNPMYGLDNWIYISNEPAVIAKVFTEEFSDLGSELVYYNSQYDTSLPPNGGGRRIKFRPDHGDMEMTSSRGQFGHTFDRWGRHFLTSNANHIYQEVIQAFYLDRNPQLLVSNSTAVISDHGAAAEVYPITIDPEHQLLTDLGVFTAACGNVFYDGGLFPPEYQGVVFTAEPVGNLVHVDIIDDSDISFQASRMFEKKEFLASEDPWFRPVNHYVGPDGALYVIDYYRRIIEHPEWMGEDAIQSGKLYDGRDQGRIFRITPNGTNPANWSENLDLGKLNPQELVSYLAHENIWYRLNAQRLLVDYADVSVVDELIAMVRNSSSSVGRLHAGWTLEGLEKLSPEIVIELLNDTEAGVRENAIILAENFLEVDQVVEKLLDLSDDDHIRVRFQLLCTLGSLDSPKVNTVRNQMLVEDIDERWMQIAALSAYEPKPEQLLSLSISKYYENEVAYQQFIQNIVSVITAGHNVDEIKRLINKGLEVPGPRGDSWRAAIFQGIVRGTRNFNLKSNHLDQERNLLISCIFSDPEDEVRNAGLELLQHLGFPEGVIRNNASKEAESIIQNKNESLSNRIRAVKFLAHSGQKATYELFEKLLIPAESNEIQRVALRSMYTIRGESFFNVLVDKWPSLTSNLRDEAVRIFLSQETGSRKLIEALEAKIIDPSAIPWPQQVGMMAQANDELRARSRVIFSSESTDEEKKQLLETYKKSIELSGDVKNGLKVYEANCAICHQIGGEFGTAYGPDLASIRNRRPESIIQDILDPGLSIADGYELWEITMKDGEVKQGIISSETGNSITLRVLGNPDEIIARENIEMMSSRSISVMPGGLENQIDIQAMADLLKFIKQLK